MDFTCQGQPEKQESGMAGGKAAKRPTLRIRHVSHTRHEIKFFFLLLVGCVGGKGGSPGSIYKVSGGFSKKKEKKNPNQGKHYAYAALAK